MKLKKLAIVSDCIHMYDNSGNVVTENHILRKQLEALSSLFEETLICCPFVQYSASQVVSAYTCKTISFLPLPNVGGNSIADKFRIIKVIPAWLRVFKKINAFADIVYQRFPNNLNIPGALYFWWKNKKVFATYTGTWVDYPGEPFTYRLQKQILKNQFRGPVFIYIKGSPKDKKYVKSFSPSFSLQEWMEEDPFIEQKVIRHHNTLTSVPLFITVGSLQKNKNQQFILEVFNHLHKKAVEFKLILVGDGPLKENYGSFIRENDLAQKVFLLGKKTSAELKLLYREADFVIQAPIAEGFGKVPVEGFCYGAIPWLSNTALAQEMIGDNERGFLFELEHAGQLAERIKCVLESRIKYDLYSMIQNGRVFSRTFTIDNWVESIKRQLDIYDEN